MEDFEELSRNLSFSAGDSEGRNLLSASRAAKSVLLEKQGSKTSEALKL